VKDWIRVAERAVRKSHPRHADDGVAVLCDVAGLSPLREADVFLMQRMEGYDAALTTRPPSVRVVEGRQDYNPISLLVGDRA